MIHEREKETDMQKRHEITDVHTCLRVTDSKIPMIQKRDKAKDATPESIIQDNRICRLGLRHIQMITEDAIDRTPTLVVEVNKADQSYDSRTNQTLTKSTNSDESETP